MKFEKETWQQFWIIISKMTTESEQIKAKNTIPFSIRLKLIMS